MKMALAALVSGCGGGGADPFASCSAGDVAAGCKMTFSGAFTGTADCTEWDGTSGAWYFSLMPGAMYPSANVAVILSNTPAGPGTYSMAQATYASADATPDGSTYWVAGKPTSGPTVGDLSLKLTQVSGGYHGVVVATLAPGSQGGGSVTFCATF